MQRILHVEWINGSRERISVACGSDHAARRLPARIGRAMMNGEIKTAVLDYDGLERCAIQSNGRFYMRIKKSQN